MPLDRRQVLRSVGVGAGAGLTGLGASSAREQGPGTEQEVEATFAAIVGSGFLVINGSGVDDDDASVSISLENIEGDIEINGEIYDDRTWESADITFPEVDPSQLIDAGDLPGFVSEINFNDESDVNVVVDTISGTYDPDANGGPLVTGNIDMSIEAFVTGNAVAFDTEIPFEFDFTIDVNQGQDITLTTEQSQDLEGEAATLGCSDPVVRVVSNQFTVPAAVGDVEECIQDLACINVNEQLELPSDVPFQNFIELDLDIEWNDEQPFSPPPVVGDSSPKDITCDGKYEDLDGDGDLTIMDVQALFDNRDNEQLESNAELYDFGNSGSDRVTIFDVQGLYNRLKNQNNP